MKKILIFWFLCLINSASYSQVTHEFCYKSILTDNKLAEIKKILETPIVEAENIDLSTLSNNDLYSWSTIENAINNSGILVQNFRHIYWLNQFQKVGKNKVSSEIFIRSSLDVVFFSISSLEKVIRIYTQKIQNSKLASILMGYRLELSKINSQLELCR